MDAKDILELVRAGYSKEEISAMSTNPVIEPPVPVEEPAPVPVEQEVVEPVPTPAPIPAPQPTPAPAQEQTQPSLNDIMRGIAQLTSAIQANAIANSVLPQSAFQQPKPEDALAEIIRPSFQERGE